MSEQAHDDAIRAQSDASRAQSDASRAHKDSTDNTSIIIKKSDVTHVLLLFIGFLIVLLGFFCRNLITDVGSTHDAVIGITGTVSNLCGRVEKIDRKMDDFVTMPQVDDRIRAIVPLHSSTHATNYFQPN